MIVLAVKVETSSRPSPGMELQDQQYPWPVEIGAVLFTREGHDLATIGTRIRAEGRTVAPGAAKSHGVSSQIAGRSGIPEKVAIAALCHFAGQAQYLTAYNTSFDVDILHASVLRVGGDPHRLVRPGLQIVDCMSPSAALCRLPSEAPEGGYRFPRLNAAVAQIRNEQPPQAHRDALSGARRVKRLFLSLLHRGALDLGEAA